MSRGFAVGSLCFVALVAPASAGSANLLGVFGTWTAYTQGEGDAMSCFAVSRPRAVEPKRAKRGAISLIATDWPARHVKAEFEIVPGYEYRERTQVVLEIGADKFSFFARNQGKEGAAWLETLSEAQPLIDAMKNGVSAVAIGRPRRGAKTVDTYSLAGFNDALVKIHAACNM
ncbi:MAG: invasion associated locus B family protein [Rhizomicrobium sp.]